MVNISLRLEDVRVQTWWEDVRASVYGDRKLCVWVGFPLKTDPHDQSVVVLEVRSKVIEHVVHKDSVMEEEFSTNIDRMVEEALANLSEYLNRLTGWLETHNYVVISEVDGG